MKHPTLRLAAVYLCLLTLFSLGMGELLLGGREARPSYTENRMLAAFPVLSFASLRDGSFMDGFESWLSDAFFFRDEAAAFSDGTKALFSIRNTQPSLSDAPEAQAWELNEEEQRELDELIEEIAGEEQEAAAAQTAPTETRRAAAPTASSAEAFRRPTPEVTQSASIWTETADGKRVPYESFPADRIAVLARILNEYRAALPEDGRVCMINPMVADLANAVLQEHTATDWASDLDDVIAPYLDEGVRFYDQTDILRPYIGSCALYPTLDHHWHPVSSKLALDAMLRDQGPVPNGYDEYRYWLDNVYDAGPFTSEELEAVTRSIEQVPVLVLNAPAESYCLEHLTELSPSLLIDHEGSLAYSQYFGGNLHTWRLFVTGFCTGRNALVIGDSFDLPFIAYLFPYYDRILVTDFRDGGYSRAEAGANVCEYIAEYGVSDVYIVYCSYFSLNTETVQDRLERYFFMDYER